jgi:hypothetical protein
VRGIGGEFGAGECVDYALQSIRFVPALAGMQEVFSGYGSQDSDSLLNFGWFYVCCGSFFVCGPL